MKKFFTLLALAMSALTVSAEDYTDAMTVKVNEASTFQDATISVNKQDNGKYSFTLKNFTLEAAGAEMPVGTIELKDVTGVESQNSVILQEKRNLTIQEGDVAGVAMWMGPMLGEVPVDLIAELRDGKLYAIINIDMQATLGQSIVVSFGNGGYQLPNAGFENFHDTHCYMPGTTQVASTAVEPNHWHSFMSASGMDALVYMAGYTPHVFTSNDVRPGSLGTKSVKLTAADMWIAIANGTMTTGRMNSGSTTATDYANHAAMDMSSTDVDENGDPFYVKMNGRPDSLAVWVKFGQGTPNANHPYATVSAAITDGNYYQEPSEETYSSVVATAKNNKIEATNGEWVRLSIPFEYVENAADPKAIMVTMSTNADPGQGSDQDSLLVDDIELIYNHEISLNEIQVKGSAIAYSENMVAEGVEGTVTASDIRAVGNFDKQFTSIEETDNGTVATVIVASEDLVSYKVAKISLSNASTGINSVNASDKNASVKKYVENGRVVIEKNGKKFNAAGQEVK